MTETVKMAGIFRPGAESVLRIAMWSGPRNVSTALLRSWGNRADAVVCDEPLYAHYLRETGTAHPGADEVIAHHEPDWRRVVEFLYGELPEGKTVFYQKHMAHHLLDNIERGWLSGMKHAFLIRDPRDMLPSLKKIIGPPRLVDTGFPQQVEIFEMMRRETGETPPVVDSRELLDDPRGVLSRLCERLGTSFDEAMLTWPRGRRKTDGVWAKHWYASVEESTGFRPFQPKVEPLDEQLEMLHAQCKDYYELLHAHRIRP